VRYWDKRWVRVATAAGAALVVLVGFWLFVRPDPKASAEAHSGGDTGPLAPFSTSPQPHGARRAATGKVLPPGLTGPGRSNNFNGSLAGFAGSGLYWSLPKHHIVLSVTSPGQIGTVGYLIPTSLDKADGVAKHVGTSWGLQTIVYGRPDYARIFLQAGASGVPISCTISVDGRVTEHRATSGPYGQLMCQG
jgi:hypothetical protein